MEQFHSQLLPDAYEPEDNGGSWRRTLLDVLETILLSVLLFAGINLVSARIRVESVSMQPTLYAGNFVFVNKLAYKVGAPERGDVIVFRYPPDPEQTPYIKRVIGLPGERISIQSGEVYINGQLIQEPYIHVPTNHNGEWVIGEQELFVMGDNRNNSSDSRSWGMVPLVNIIGKAEVVYWPPENWAMLHFPAAVAAEP